MLTLDLSYNNFEGTVPSFKGFPLLDILRLSDNQFVGPLPDVNSKLAGLTLDNNLFSMQGVKMTDWLSNVLKNPNLPKCWILALS